MCVRECVKEIERRRGRMKKSESIGEEREREREDAGTTRRVTVQWCSMFEDSTVQYSVTV